MRTGPSYVPADANALGVSALDRAAVTRIRRLQPRGHERVMQLAREYEVSTRTVYRALKPDRYRCCCGQTFINTVALTAHVRTVMRG